MPEAQGQVIRPAAFATDEELEQLEEIGPVYTPEEMAAVQQQARDMMTTAGNSASTAVDFVKRNQTTIKNIAFVVGGTYLLIKGPPILARSFAETMHFLREGWHGRGYSDRWTEDNKKE